MNTFKFALKSFLIIILSANFLSASDVLHKKDDDSYAYGEAFAPQYFTVLQSQDLLNLPEGQNDQNVSTQSLICEEIESSSFKCGIKYGLLGLADHLMVKCAFLGNLYSIVQGNYTQFAANATDLEHINLWAHVCGYTYVFKALENHTPYSKDTDLPIAIPVVMTGLLVFSYFI